MDIDIDERMENELFDREELALTLNHPQEATPSANDVRRQLAAELDVDPLTIGIDHIYSSSGLSRSTAAVKIYAEPIMDELPAEEEDASDEASDQPDEERGDEPADAAEPGETAEDTADDENRGDEPAAAAEDNEDEPDEAEEDADGGETDDEPGEKASEDG